MQECEHYLYVTEKIQPLIFYSLSSYQFQFSMSSLSRFLSSFFRPSITPVLFFILSYLQFLFLINSVGFFFRLPFIFSFTGYSIRSNWTSTNFKFPSSLFCIHCFLLFWISILSYLKLILLIDFFSDSLHFSHSIWSNWKFLTFRILFNQFKIHLCFESTARLFNQKRIRINNFIDIH